MSNVVAASLPGVICVALLLVGCASPQVFHKQYTLVVTGENVPIYQRAGADVGDSIGELSVARGDLVPAFAFRYIPSDLDSYHYLVYERGDSLWVRDGRGVIKEYDYLVEQQRRTFTLPASEDPTVWGRAIKYINGQYSSMKIQSSTDLLIQTHTPTSAYKEGYTVSKVSFGDSVEYTVDADIGGERSRHNLEWIIGKEFTLAKRLALYMRTGRDE